MEIESIAMIRRLLNRITASSPNEIRPQSQSQEPYTASNSYLLTPELSKLYNDELKRIASDFYRVVLPAVDNHLLPEAIDAFLKIYQNRPFVDNSGGSGYHNLFWLFTYIYLRKPDVVVESGTWKGMSSWAMHEAAPDAEMFCFDLRFKRLQYRNERFKYLEMDWSGYQFGGVNVENSLCFFDDHVNQARRIIEAHEKGFRTIIFDDAVPAHQVYAFGAPPLPTVPMLFDKRLNGQLKMEWMFKNQYRSFLYDSNNEEVIRARELIESHHVFPDVSLVSQFDKNRFLTIVNLKP